jgi:hypothetical protein
MARDEVGRHTDRAGLAVGAGHVDYRITILGIGEQVEQSRDALQARLYAATDVRVQVGNGSFVVRDYPSSESWA